MSLSLSNKKLITISQAAKILGVSIDTVRRWDKAGILHAERANGKNRYFSAEELEKHKANQPYSISGAAKKLKISLTTLRRLESRGLLVPQRNGAGERIYSKDSINEFLKSDYYLRKQLAAQKPPRIKKVNTPKKKANILNDISFENEPDRSKKSAFSIFITRHYRYFYRLPEISAAVIIFGLLFAIGTTNIALANINRTPAARTSQAVPVKTTTQSQEVVATDSAGTEDIGNPALVDEPSIETITLGSIQALIDGVDDYKTLQATAGANEKKEGDESGGPSSSGYKVILSVKTNGAEHIDIKEKPASDSAKIYEAKEGDTFEMISRTVGWYHIKLTESITGYIADTFIRIQDIK